MLPSAAAWAARVDSFVPAYFGGFGLYDVDWSPENFELSKLPFSLDPRRELDAHLSAIASYVEPKDVVIDVGGGTGRLGLPLALRCREVIDVDLYPQTFEAAAAQWGVRNVRFVQADWQHAEGVEGDVAIVAHVLELVREVVPFIHKLQAAARRRAIVLGWAPWFAPDPRLVRLLTHGEPENYGSGYLHLLPVLWEMGIDPSVHFLPRLAYPDSGVRRPQSQEEAVESLVSIWPGMRLRDPDHAKSVIRDHIAELFAETPEGFVPLQEMRSRALLITWNTHGKPGAA